jgi:hypothetical protein
VHKATRPDRLRVHDDNEGGIVASVLANDACFQEKVDRVALAEPSARRDVAEHEARDYAPYERAHHGHITGLLLAGANEDDRRLRSSIIATTPHVPVWPDLPLHDHDPRRAKQRWQRLKEGADRLALLGAHLCIGCGKTKTRAAERGRRRHCSACEERLGRAICAAQVDAIRTALDAATGQHRARRASRRAIDPSQ